MNDQRFIFFIAYCNVLLQVDGNKQSCKLYRTVKKCVVFYAFYSFFDPIMQTKWTLILSKIVGVLCKKKSLSFKKKKKKKKKKKNSVNNKHNVTHRTHWGGNHTWKFTVQLNLQISYNKVKASLKSALNKVKSSPPFNFTFKGTVLRDRFRKCWRKLTDLGLTKSRGWILNFLQAPIL